MEEKIQDFITRINRFNYVNLKTNTVLFDYTKQLSATNDKLAICLFGFMNYFKIGTEVDLSKEIWSKIVPLDTIYEFLPGYFLHNINGNFEVTLTNDNPIILILRKQYNVETYNNFINMAERNFYMAMAKVSYMPELAYGIALHSNNINDRLRYLKIAAEYNHEKAILAICNLYEYPIDQTFETKVEFIKTLRETNLSNAKKAWEYLVENYRGFARYNLELCKFIYRHPELGYDRLSREILSKCVHQFAECYTLFAMFIMDGRYKSYGYDMNTAYHCLTKGAAKGDLDAYFYIAVWFKAKLTDADDIPNRHVLCVTPLTHVMYEGARTQTYKIIMRAYRELRTIDQVIAENTLKMVKKIWPDMPV